jgi:hypothetical protein
MCRAFVLAAALLVFAGDARAGDPSASVRDRWSLASLMDRAGVDRAWADRVAEMLPASVRELPDAAELQVHISELIPAQLKHLPGLGDHKEDQEMRAMVIAMGAMSGYMIAAMPFTLSGVAWAVGGGVAAQYWYDNYR